MMGKGSLWRETGGGNLGVMGAGSLWEAKEERDTRDGIPKGAGAERNRK